MTRIFLRSSSVKNGGRTEEDPGHMQLVCWLNGDTDFVIAITKGSYNGIRGFYDDISGLRIHCFKPL
ncbi:hypothetical protein [Chitinophaga sp. CF418]|uniref:hypothetical protein n=1 Tax=Chitinophaga sp. CF418 TaxID=1855287 RepID=UPI00122D2B80|nr:hypothetical protein [Chitinophaga sp. CF418]